MGKLIMYQKCKISDLAGAGLHLRSPLVGVAAGARYIRAILLRVRPPMSRAVAGPEIERLIQLLARLPGLGPRSARRAALHLIKKRETLMAPLGAALGDALDKIVVCRVCGNVDTA